MCLSMSRTSFCNSMRRASKAALACLWCCLVPDEGRVEAVLLRFRP